MDLKYTCLKFDDLTTHELYEILKLRQEVFVVEQNCPYLDADGKDQVGLHVIIRYEDELVAYTRLLPKGISYPEHTSISRVINKKSIRGKGIGKALMVYSIEKIKEHFPNENIKISAQTYLEKFYNDLGFKKIGTGYLEDDIPHQAMILNFDD